MEVEIEGLRPFGPEPISGFAAVVAAHKIRKRRLMNFVCGEAAVNSLPFSKARVLQRTLEPGPSWCLYCTLRRLPFVARPE